MNSRITQVFQQKPAFIAYLTVGDGGLDRTLEAALALIAGGVDILEVGVPFSDPVADGPVIQQAAARAVAAGVGIKDVLTFVRRLRQKTATPVILFTYYNPLLQASKSCADFWIQVRDAGVDGCLVVDLPLEESERYWTDCTAAGIDPILMLSPTTPLSRVKQIAAASRGMLYYASRSGVTGVRDHLPEDLAQRLCAIKQITSLPVAVGFSIANRSMAQAVINQADGFVVGSLLVAAVGQGKTPAALTQLARSLDPRN